MAFLDTMQQMIQQARPNFPIQGSPHVSVPPTMKMSEGSGDMGKSFGEGMSQGFIKTYLEPLIEAKRDQYKYNNDPATISQRLRGTIVTLNMISDPDLRKEAEASKEVQNTYRLARQFDNAGILEDKKNGLLYFAGMDPISQKQWEERMYSASSAEQKKHLYELPIKKQEAELGAAQGQQEYYGVQKRLAQNELNLATKYSERKAKAQTEEAETLSSKAKQELSFLPTEQALKREEVGLRRAQVGMEGKRLSLEEQRLNENIQDQDVKTHFTLYANSVKALQSKLTDQTMPMSEKDYALSLSRSAVSLINGVKMIGPEMLARAEPQSAAQDVALTLNRMYSSLQRDFDFTVDRETGGTRLTPKTLLGRYLPSSKGVEGQVQLQLIRNTAGELIRALSPSAGSGMITTPELKSQLVDLFFAGMSDDEKRKYLLGKPSSKPNVLKTLPPRTGR